MRKSGFGLIITTRGFFNPVLAEEGRRMLMKKLDEMGYNYVVLSGQQTKFGAVETVEDGKKCAELFYKNKDRISGIIVCAPNFGDEIGVVTALNEANLNVPVLVQACDDEPDKMDLEHRRDAFCGKLSICNNLYQYNIKFTDTAMHTCSIDSSGFTEDILFFDRVCSVVSGMRKARIAQIGTRPTPFQTVRYSEKLLQNSGITIIPVDFSRIMFQAREMNNTQEVLDRINEIKEYGKIACQTSDEAIKKSAKLSIAIEKFMDENECNAGAVQCWDSIQLNYGCAACLPMSMINEKGRPMACETDVAGAAAMYALYLASGQSPGYCDWNNNYMNERDKCILIHCSSYPKSFMADDFEISSLDVLGNALGHENCFGGLKGQVAAGPMTYAKISTDDRNGVVRAYTGEGEFTDDTIETAGGRGVCRINNLQDLLKYICKNGFEHHVAVNRSNSSRVLKEALGNYLGWSVYLHK